MKYLLLSLVFIISSCAVYKTRRAFSESDLSLKGGVFEDKEWNTNLDFRRFSWYKDATMANEILIAKLDGKSPFANWMGAARLHVSKCDQFYIGLLYSDVNAEQGNPFLESEIEKSGIELITILDFKKELNAHQNYRDWHLTRHKVYGLCASRTAEALKITLPGFGTQEIKL